MGLYLEDGPVGGYCGSVHIYVPVDMVGPYMDRMGWAFMWTGGPLFGQAKLLCGQSGILSGQIGPYLDIGAFIWKMGL